MAKRVALLIAVLLTANARADHRANDVWVVLTIDRVRVSPIKPDGRPWDKKHPQERGIYCSSDCKAVGRVGRVPGGPAGKVVGAGLWGACKLADAEHHPSCTPWPDLFVRVDARNTKPQHTRVHRGTLATNFNAQMVVPFDGLQVSVGDHTPKQADRWIGTIPVSRDWLAWSLKTGKSITFQKPGSIDEITMTVHRYVPSTK